MNQSGQSESQGSRIETSNTVGDGDSRAEPSSSSKHRLLRRRTYLGIVTAGVTTAVLSGQSVVAESGPGYGAGGYGAGGYGHGDETSQPPVDDDDDHDESDETEEYTAPELETISAEEITASSAILSGFLWESGSAESVTVLFEYRQTGSEEWRESLSETRSTYGTVEQEIVRLSPSTTYEYRIVADDGETRVTGDTKRFETRSTDASTPSIDDLSLELSPADAQTYLDVDWSVSDADGDLQTVTVLVSDYHRTIRWEISTVDGSSASGSERMVLSDDHIQRYEVTISVTDHAGNHSLERKQIS